ncbi:DNA gyrase inhibitor YacG [Bartonella sp. B10]
MKQLKQKKKNTDFSGKSAEMCEAKTERLRSPHSDTPHSRPSHSRPSHPCPVCGKISQQNAYPFCSTRCRAIDLNRWLSGAYILPQPLQKTDEEE